MGASIATPNATARTVDEKPEIQPQETTIHAADSSEEVVVAQPDHADAQEGDQKGDQRRPHLLPELARCHYRSGPNAARNSFANSSGSSHAAKCPPLGSLL